MNISGLTIEKMTVEPTTIKITNVDEAPEEYGAFGILYKKAKEEIKMLDTSGELSFEEIKNYLAHKAFAATFDIVRESRLLKELDVRCFVSYLTSAISDRAILYERFGISTVEEASNFFRDRFYTSKTDPEITYFVSNPSFISLKEDVIESKAFTEKEKAIVMAAALLHFRVFDEDGYDLEYGILHCICLMLCVNSKIPMLEGLASKMYLGAKKLVEEKTEGKNNE